MGGFQRPFGISMPNQTVYINNLNDKISKELLRRCVNLSVSAAHVRLSKIRQRRSLKMAS
jgi:hypothetical protein